MRTHYENLKVAENAPQEVIKAAYRALSQQHHPDRNPERTAESVRVMQILNDAYDALSDPIRRKEHDETIRRWRTNNHGGSARPTSPGTAPPPVPKPAPQEHWHTLENDALRGPFTPAQLLERLENGLINRRTLVRREASSEWITLREMLQRRRGTDGAGAGPRPGAEQKRSSKAAETWGRVRQALLAGGGVAFLVAAIVKGTSGRPEPSASYPSDFRPTSAPAVATLVNSTPAPESAGFVPREPARPVASPRPPEPQTATLPARQSQSPSSTRPPTINWRLPPEGMRISDQFEESLSPYTDLAAQPLPALPLATPATIVPSGRRVAGQPYVRPALSPHGHPWPTRTGYLKGCPVRWDDGHGQITVDNTRNDSDVHVKLVGTDGVIVREAFIKEGTEMLFKDLRPGPYQVRYRDLDSGALAKADPFDLTEERTSRGITYSSISLTLYKVAHGNTELQPMSEEEF